MSVTLNHTIVWCRDKKASARYLTGLLGLGDPRPWGPVRLCRSRAREHVDAMGFPRAPGRRSVLRKLLGAASHRPGDVTPPH